MNQTLPPSADDEEDFPEPPRLRRLRRMVMALTVALTVGILAIAGALVWRVATEGGGAPALTAEEVTLPAGLEIVAVGGDGAHLFVITRAPDGTERIHAFRKSDGAPAGEARVVRP